MTGCQESQEVFQEAIKAGLGVTVISKRAVRDELDLGFLRGYRIENLDLTRNFYLVFRKDCVLPPLSRAFFKFTQGFFDEDLEP